MKEEKYDGFRNPVLSVAGMIVSCFLIYACIESIRERDFRNALPIMSVTCIIMIPSIVSFVRSVISHGSMHEKSTTHGA